MALGHLEGPSGPLDPTPLTQVTVDIDPSFIVMQTASLPTADWMLQLRPMSDSTLIATQLLLGLATCQKCKKKCDRGGGGKKGTSLGLGF